jgi:hypothetical protein
MFLQENDAAASPSRLAAQPTQTMPYVDPSAWPYPHTLFSVGHNANKNVLVIVQPAGLFVHVKYSASDYESWEF